ncbi:MAG: hypothetical protein GY896_24645 [Gammaproteobacteria bacterium]|nr:hypothetical protein [Gammaproteobacteria bacterium]
MSYVSERIIRDQSSDACGEFGRAQYIEIHAVYRAIKNRIGAVNPDVDGVADPVEGWNLSQAIGDRGRSWFCGW